MTADNEITGLGEFNKKFEDTYKLFKKNLSSDYIDIYNIGIFLGSRQQEILKNISIIKRLLLNLNNYKLRPHSYASVLPSYPINKSFV